MNLELVKLLCDIINTRRFYSSERTLIIEGKKILST